MSLLTRAADLTYSFRFLTLLVTPFEETNAYKLGVIDETGKRINKNSPLSHDQKAAYNSFHKLVFNIKKLLAKVPGGSSRIASYAAALYLLKDNYSFSDKKLRSILQECGYTTDDILAENNQWFVLPDKMLSPGVYKLKDDKVLSENHDDVYAKDKIKVEPDCYPVGDIFGLDIYQATHIRTNKTVHIAVGELLK